MATWTRRRFVAGVIATGVSLPVAAAAEPADEPDPMLEFDGKPQNNPKGSPDGTFKAAGVVRPPDGWKVEEVTVRWQPYGTANPNVYEVSKATIDHTQTPVKWTAKGERLTVGEHWVDAFVTFVTPQGERKTFYSLDKRRILIPVKG